jgi:hypothetical protein
MTDKPKPQIDKFKEAAREVRTDDSEERFDRVLKKVATSPKPVPKSK